MLLAALVVMGTGLAVGTPIFVAILYADLDLVPYPSGDFKGATAVDCVRIGLGAYLTDDTDYKFAETFIVAEVLGGCGFAFLEND